MRQILVKPLYAALLCTWLQAAPAAAAAPTAVCAPWLAHAGGVALGAAGSFVAHEYGHLLANAAYRNQPSLVPVRGLFGVPFVAISPGIACGPGGCKDAHGQPFLPGRRGLAAISAAGFFAQHATSEVLFLAHRGTFGQAPAVWQGFFTLNVALSLAYATTCWLGAENNYGDASGTAAAARLPRQAVAAALVVPALLDLGRSLWPKQRVLAYASWASKAAFVGLVVAR